MDVGDQEEALLLFTKLTERQKALFIELFLRVRPDVCDADYVPDDELIGIESNIN